jgi:hypothetical protein
MKKFCIFVFISITLSFSLFAQNINIGGNWQAVVPAERSHYNVWALALINSGVRSGDPQLMENIFSMNTEQEILTALSIDRYGFDEIRTNPPRLIVAGGTSGRVMLNWRGMTMEGTFEVNSNTAVFNLSFGFGQEPIILTAIIYQNFLIFNNDGFVFDVPITFAKP